MADELPRAEEAILFLPGVALEANSKSVGNVSREFAEYNEVPTYAISTRTVSPDVSDSQYHQAEAISKFVAEKKFKKLKIVGHSQGGNKAIDLVYLLQESNPEIDISGLVLIDSAGLYKQDSASILDKFTRDSLIETPQTAVKKFGRKGSFAKHALLLGEEVAAGILKEAAGSPRQFRKRAKREETEAAALNKRAAELTCPVILVQGAKDLVSDYRQIVPSPEEASQLEGTLKENLFRQSPYVRMLVAKKAGHHGLAYFRSKEVAETSSYMLERFTRERSRPNA